MNQPTSPKAELTLDAIPPPPAMPPGSMCVQVVINPPQASGAASSESSAFGLQAEPTINTTGTAHETVMALNLAMSLMLQHVTDRVAAPPQEPSRIIRIR